MIRLNWTLAAAWPRHNIWNPLRSDCLQHTDQIAYIRGKITGKGWFAV